MAGGSDATVAENTSIGINLAWDVTDRLSLMFDYHDSDAEQRPDSPFRQLFAAGHFRILSRQDNNLFRSWRLASPGFGT
jgi:hypothetical protein